MDSSGFDALTRVVSSATARRGLVRGMLGAVTALIAGQAVVADADAASCVAPGKSCKPKRGQPKQKCCGRASCRGNTCKCTGNTRQCGKECIKQSQCCKNSDCPDGEVCNNKNACVAKTCTENANCGANGSGCSCTQSGRDDVPGTGTCQSKTFTQTFQKNANGWFAMLDQNNTWNPPATDDTIVIEDGHAVLKAADAYPPAYDLTAMSPLGGRTTVFPAGGFDVSLEIYLDPAVVTAYRRFAYSAAANATDCTHLRDFIFHVGANAAGTAVCVGADNNAWTGNNDVCVMPGAVNLTTGTTGAGWYRFDHEFRNAGGVLSVEMTVTALAGDAEVFTRTLSNIADAISGVGGIRYAFVPFNNYAEGVQIRNSKRVNRD